MVKDIKVLFVLNPALGHVTVYLRGLIFKDVLASRGWKVTYVNLSGTNFNEELDQLRKSEDEIVELGKQHDVIYLLKVNSLKFVRRLRRETNAKIVFELTDALWKPSFRFRGWIHLEEILFRSDAVFSENEFVCEYGRKYNKHVYSIAACTQTEKFEEQKRLVGLRNDGKIALGWIGSPDTATALFSILKPLENLFRKYPFLELRILGADKNRLEGRLGGVRYTLLSSYNEDEMIREALSIDIGIFPAPSDLDDYKIRGALKGMIYMAAGKPAVCLNAGDCAKLITDGVNGMLIDHVNDWEAKIEKLILNPELRERMGKAAFETIKKEHSLDYASQDLERALLEVLNQKGKISGELSMLEWLRIRSANLNSLRMMAHQRVKKLAISLMQHHDITK